MALRTPPSWLQNGSHPAENDRLTTQAIWKTTGVINSTDMAVTQSAVPAMSVSISSGWAAIVGTSTATQGTYVAYNDAAVTAIVTNADPTNPRIDRVVATVADAYYTGSTNTVTYSVIAGTPAGSPVAPATPTSSISLATISIAAASTSVLNAAITDTRVLATNPFVVTTLNQPILTSPIEVINVAAIAATGTVNVDVNTSAVWYYTTNATANFTLNFRASGAATLSSILAVGQSMTVVFLNTNGATPYYANVYQIDGVAVTPKWGNGVAPSAGNASAIDAYQFTIIKTAATPTYTVIAGQVKYA